jgi:hypothetical protein
MSIEQTDVRATLERVRLEVLSLLSRTPLELEQLYHRVREALGWDTDMAVASVISLLCRARVIIMEPLSYDDPTAGMRVSMAGPEDAAFAL